MSEALRTVDDSTKLPERYVKSIDWIRFGLAESLFDILVVDEGASALFSKIKSLHAAFPCKYSLIFRLARSDDV